MEDIRPTTTFTADVLNRMELVENDPSYKNNEVCVPLEMGQMMVLTSIAISLKRLADSVEEILIGGEVK